MTFVVAGSPMADYNGSPPRLWSVPVDYGPYDSPPVRFRRSPRSPVAQTPN